MFAAMLDESVGHVGDAELLVSERIFDEIAHSFVAFGLDGGGAVSKRFLHEGDDVGLGLVLIAFRVFACGRFLSHDRDW